MEIGLWHQRWAQGQIGFHQREINRHLQEFWERLATPAGSRVFVPLCGKSRDMLWLRSRGHPVLGVEVSPIAVGGFFRENGLEPTVDRQGHFQAWRTGGLCVLCGDFFDLSAADLDGCRGVYDRASLVALPQGMREDYVRHLNAILPRVARILLVTMEYPPNEMQGPPFPVREHEVYALYGPYFDIEDLFTLDILAENPRFQERGLTRLVERVFHLTPRE